MVRESGTIEGWDINARSLLYSRDVDFKYVEIREKIGLFTYSLRFLSAASQVFIALSLHLLIQTRAVLDTLAQNMGLYWSLI